MSTLAINIVTGPFLPCGGGPGGAVEKRWFGVAQQFVKKGHRVTIISREWKGLPKREAREGVRIIRIEGYSRTGSLARDLGKDLIYSANALRASPAAHITVTNAFWAPLLMSGLKGRFGTIVVNVARYPKGQMGIYRWVDRLSAVSSAISDGIIAQSPGLRGLVATIPNPIDTERFTYDRRPRPEVGRYRLLYTGRVHPEKGLHLLVPAVKKLLCDFPSLELSIVGPSALAEGGGGREYVAELSRLGEGVAVRFEPAIYDPTELAGRMRQADYYCYPSIADRGEAFGVAPLEAMALGYAPVLSGLACFREYAEDGQNCFVFDHRSANAIDSLADSLKRAMSTPLRTQIMGRCAVDTARKFSYEYVASRYLEDWSNLLLQGKK